MSRRDKAYSTLMIVQMCCAKLLCHKQELSKDIYCDRMNLLYGASSFSADFAQQVHSESLRQFVERLRNQVFSTEILSEPMVNYFINLFDIIKEDSNGGIVRC